MKHFTAEIGETKLAAISDEHGVRIGEENSPVTLHDGDKLRSFIASLSDQEHVPVYVAQGDSDHSYNVYVRGEVIPVTVVTPRDERLNAFRKTMSAVRSSGQTITAPMPGMLKQMLVKEGTTVQKGDALCILEAMKMENEIKSPARLVVKRVIAREGMAVEKGAPLVELTAPAEPAL